MPRRADSGSAEMPTPRRGRAARRLVSGSTKPRLPPLAWRGGRGTRYVATMVAAIERTERLRVLTLNIWNRQGPWEERVRLIREGLVALDPDVVGLQEVMRHDAVAADQADEI